jgi:putative membrane protein
VIWVKALHIISMVTWFAALFYLPRLFVYHATTEDQAGHQRFVIMERKLYMMMNIGMMATWVCGLWLVGIYGMSTFAAMYWLHAKLVLVIALMAYHLYCKRIINTFEAQNNTRSHVWFRVFNEVPVLLLIAVVILAVVKPF